MKRRTLILILAIVLVFGIAVGGTIAWLIDTTDPVVNTFTVGNIDITLQEHPLKSGDDYDGMTIDTSAETTDKVDNYKMIPGRTLQKDPFITVKKDSEECWLFIRIDKSANFDTFMEYTVDTTVWNKYTGAQWNGQDIDLWYRQVPAATADTDYYILKDNQVTVKSGVTQAQLQAVGDNKPTLTFIAYACQSEGLDTYTAAWQAITR